MCIAKPPKPKPAPPPPDPNAANLKAIEEQRSAAASRSTAADNILTRLSKEDVAASALKKKLGQ